MSIFASLEGWEITGHSLHKATQLIGAIRMLLLERVPNYLELSTVIKADGLSSGILPAGDEVMVNFKKAALEYINEKGYSTEILLNGNSQASLLEQLLEANGAEGKMLPDRGDRKVSLGELFLDVLARKGHPFLPKREDLLDETPLVVDREQSAAYIEALYGIFAATARFRARLNGPMTPVVVWPEHFDLSFLWFATPEANDNFPHMNFGFAPYSEGLSRPYLYAYAYPMPEGFEELELAAPARWNTEGWKGVVVPYDELVKLPEPENSIEEIFMQIYRLLSPSLAGVTLLQS